MGETIWTEAKDKSRGLSDIDYHRRRYTMLIEDFNEEGKDIRYLVRFVAPAITSYERNRYYLLANSTWKKVPENYYYRPDYMSFREYNTTNYWTLLLFINNIPLIEEFNKPEILVPSLNAVLTMNRYTGEYNYVENIVPLAYIKEGDVAPLYTKESQIRPPDNTVNPLAELEGEFYYHREQHTVTRTIALQKYIDLERVPNQNSIIFRIDNQRAFVYGKDYVVKRGTDGKDRRISWNGQDTPNGDGLASVIEEGMLIEIQYAIGDV